MRVFECAGKRYRMTPQRQAVLDVLGRPDSEPDAAWVYQEVRKLMPGISEATVYRTMSLLREAGFIKAARAVPPSGTDAVATRIHCLASCANCGRIVEVTLDLDSSLEVQAASATGYVITEHQLALRGLCPSCAQEFPVHRK